MHDDTMTPDAHFERHKPLLFSIAYRMLGSVMDAEDVVQEVYLRWQAAAAAQTIDAPKAYMASIATRLSIDQLKSARQQREVYIGEWLPQPLFDDAPDLANDPDTLSIAFLKVLESLTPAERAVLLLRDVFDYRFDEIATIVDRSQDTCRQLLHRARQKIAVRHPRYAVDQAQHEALLGRFMQAAAGGDMQGLMALLTTDVVTYSDGGGKVSAALRPVRGADAVARMMIALGGRIAADQRVSFERVNGRATLVIYNADGQRFSVTSFDTTGEQVRGIYIIMNPEKL
jgi:RNA polymerase sigma-70 factor, ECF subfamily